MKIETVVIIAKLISRVAIGACTPTGTALAQWANSGEWPQPIQWILISMGAITGAATAMDNFLSNAFNDYLAGKRSDMGYTSFFGKSGGLTTPPPPSNPGS